MTCFADFKGKIKANSKLPSLLRLHGSSALGNSLWTFLPSKLTKVAGIRQDISHRFIGRHINIHMASFIQQHQVILVYHSRSVKKDPQPKSEVFSKLDEEVIDLQKDLLLAVLEMLESFISRTLPSSWFYVNCGSPEESAGSFVIQLLISETPAVLDLLSSKYERSLKNLFPMTSLSKEISKLLKKSKNSLFASELLGIVENLYKSANAELLEEVSNVELDKVGDSVAQEIFGQEIQQLNLEGGSERLETVNNFIRCNYELILKQLNHHCVIGCDGEKSHEYSLKPDMTKWQDYIGHCKVNMMSLKKSDIDWYLLLTSNLGLSEADLISLLKGRPEFQESMDDISEDNRKHIETLKKRFDLTS